MVLFRVVNGAGSSTTVDVGMLMVGVVTSLFLFAHTYATESEYLWKILNFGALPIVIGWSLLWFGWMAASVVNIVR